MEAIPYTNSEVNTLHLSDNQPTEVCVLTIIVIATALIVPTLAYTLESQPPSAFISYMESNRFIYTSA